MRVPADGPGPGAALPATLIAGPLTDALANARNDLTAALREVQPLNPDMEPSPAQLAAVTDMLLQSMKHLTPVLTALHSGIAADGVAIAAGCGQPSGGLNDG